MLRIAVRALAPALGRPAPAGRPAGRLTSALRGIAATSRVEAAGGTSGIKAASAWTAPRAVAPFAGSAAAIAATASRAAPGGGGLRSLLELGRRPFSAAATATVSAAPGSAAAAGARVAAGAVAGAGARPWDLVPPGVSPGVRRLLAAWLAGSAAWVGVLIVLGGITRLTRSGLSMTDWRFTGERVPRTQAEWEAEFEKYKKSPEFVRVNSLMTVDEFKFIYLMEYGHRTWARALGGVFLLPATFFVWKGALRGALARRVALLFAAGGTQGLVGWWMVRSGLKDELLETRREPRVSPYRLASHLASAMGIFAGLVWTALDVVRGGQAQGVAAAGGDVAARSYPRALLRPMRPLAALVALTALSGAFVAGNDAGRAYNTFPDMNGEWIPGEYWEVEGWRNAFESTAATQLHHRALAVGTLVSALALAAAARGLPGSSRTHHLVRAVAGAALAQACLGIATLLMYVPVSLGSAHQTGALVVLTGALAALHSARRDAGIAGTGARHATAASLLVAGGLGAVGYAVANHN